MNTAAARAPWDGMPFAGLWAALPKRAARTNADPFGFRARMAIYRDLIEGIGHPEFMGSDRAHHFLWGYVSQLYWQYASGRLGVPGSDAIAADSWWGNLNSTLCVVPWVAAMRAGLLPGVRIEPPSDPARAERFIHGIPGALHIPRGLRRPLRKWERVLRRLAVEADPTAREATRVLTWDAHLASIRAGERLYGRDLEAYSKLEQTFCRGWTRMVDFLGASAWRTDLVFLCEQGVGNLPPRLLRDDDEPGRVAEFAPGVNRTTRSIVKLGQRPAWANAWGRLLWSRAMRDPSLRRDAPAVVDATFGGKGPDPQLRRRLRRAMLRL